jgi:hypothetical protein
MMTKPKAIDEFGEFIRDNQGFLAAIGIFGALTKYFFFTAADNEFTKFVLKDNVLPVFTFLLFAFLCATFFIKVYNNYFNKKTTNDYISIFGVIFFFFTLAIIGYFISFFSNWFKWGVIVTLLLFILVLCGRLYGKYVKNETGIISKLIHLLIGVVLFCMLTIIKPMITNEFLLWGIFVPIYLSVLFFLLLHSIVIITRKIIKYIKKH